MRINTGCFVDGCKCFDPNDEDGVEIKNDREWQGLTDEECLQNPYCAGESDSEVIRLARAIEAKLKEKNT